MKCPFCRKSKTKVIDSRTANRGFVIRRRRACIKCRRRFTTYERPGEVLVVVVKRDGSRETFDPEKLRGGVALACNKRPVSARQIDAIVQRVEQEVLRQPGGEISSRLIGELVLRRLQRLDPVAYVRFASVYRSFSDVEQFITESRAVKKK